MKTPKLVTLVAALSGLAACVPARSAIFDPVDRDVERRLGVRAQWIEQARDGLNPRLVALLREPLSRADAVRLALANNRALQADYDQLGIAASELGSALGPTELEIGRKVALDGGSAETEVDITQDVLDLIQLPRQRAIAQAGLEAARARAVIATLSLATRTELAWVDAVGARQDLELRRTAFAAADASAEITERMYAAGNLPVLALARERNRRERARLDVARAETDVAIKHEALAELLGLEAESFTVIGRLPDAPTATPMVDDLEREALAASLELRVLRQDQTAAAGRRSVARLRAWLPELGVGASVARREGEWEVGPTLRLGLPIFDQQQGPRARAAAELSRARNQIAATIVAIRSSARAAARQVRDTHAEAHRLRTVIVPLQELVAESTLEQYNAMNASSFELLATRAEQVEAGRQYIDAVRRFWRADVQARALARGIRSSAPSAELSSNTSTSTPKGH